MNANPGEICSQVSSDPLGNTGVDRRAAGFLFECSPSDIVG
jgi:hypothetical protein